MTEEMAKLLHKTKVFHRRNNDNNKGNRGVGGHDDQSYKAMTFDKNNHLSSFFFISRNEHASIKNSFDDK